MREQNEITIDGRRYAPSYAVERLPTGHALCFGCAFYNAGKEHPGCRVVACTPVARDDLSDVIYVEQQV